jgi:hypothetical protein
MEELQELIKFLKDKGLQHKRINLDVLCATIEYFNEKALRHPMSDQKAYDQGFHDGANKTAIELSNGTN